MHHEQTNIEIATDFAIFSVLSMSSPQRQLTKMEAKGRFAHNLRFGRHTGMSKRGPSSFRKLDAERAIRSARAAGITPTMVEIETKDGAIIRVYGATPPEVVSATEWDAEIEKLKAKRK
jgi:hypothetical protein